MGGTVVLIDSEVVFQKLSDHYKIWMQKSCNGNKGLIISIY